MLLFQVISSYGVGKVIASGNPRFAEGDYVVGNISWGEYSISKGFFLRKLDPMGLPLSYHIGVLGNFIFNQSSFDPVLMNKSIISYLVFTVFEKGKILCF